MDLIVIVYAIVLSVIVCRNFPGVLEVCLFNTVTKLKQYSYSIVTIITYVIVSLCILFTCSRLGLEWEQLQWLVAALSVGLGFGLQEIFGNFISGIILLFERPIRIGDIITLNGHSGVVSRIRIRSTTITDFEKKEYVVPNKDIITSPLVNWSLNDPITRITIIASVAYGTKIEKAKEILYKICKDNPYVLDDPSPQVYFTEFGASTLNFEIRVYTAKTKDRNPARDSINSEIYRQFEENGIEIAFNQLDVYIKNTKSDQEILVKTMDSKEIMQSIKANTVDTKSK
jgi:potassium efflux system protein